MSHKLDAADIAAAEAKVAVDKVIVALSELRTELESNTYMLMEDGTAMLLENGTPIFME